VSTRVHAAVGTLALVTVASFWISTVWSEVTGDPVVITTVKRGILWGMAWLVPLMALTGGSGFRLARGWSDPLIARKLWRMKLAGANGLLVLAPSAVVLAQRASAGQFDRMFYVVQAVELAAGLAQLMLLGLNMRDGLRLSGRLATRG
jgi:hypothetical protein